ATRRSCGRPRATAPCPTNAPPPSASAARSKEFYRSQEGGQAPFHWNEKRARPAEVTGPADYAGTRRPAYATARRLLLPSPRIVLARSAALAPSTSRELTNRSMETDGSPASILATRDWLERRRLASSTCDTPRLCRRSRRLRLRDNFISMSAASASDKSKNSCTDPTAQPAALSLSRLLFFIPPSLAHLSGGHSR